MWGCAAPSTAGPWEGLWGQAGFCAALRKLVPRFPDFNSSCLCQLRLKFCFVGYVVELRLRLVTAIPPRQQARLQPQVLLVPATWIQGRVGCPEKGGQAVND